jgi:hypothetical protein
MRSKVRGFYGNLETEARGLNKAEDKKNSMLLIISILIHTQWLAFQVSTQQSSWEQK